MLNFKVSGMTCEHCVATVTKAVQSVRPGSAVAVNLQLGEVTMPDGADAQAVQRAIVAAGYGATLSPASDAATSDPTPAVKSSCCCG